MTKLILRKIYAICEYCETEFNTRDFFNYLNSIGWIADRETYDGGLVSAINYNTEMIKDYGCGDGRTVNRFSKTRDIWRHIFVSESFRDEKTIYIEVNASYFGKSRLGRISFDKNYGFNISRSNGIQYTEEDLPNYDFYALGMPDDKKERYFLNENYENFVINYITKSFKEHIKENSATSIKTKKTIKKESGLSQ